MLSTCCKLKQECSLIGVLPKLPFFWIERGELFLEEHSSGNASVGRWECLCTIIELSQSKSHGTFSFLIVISYSSSDEQLREFGILYLGLENANSPFPTSVRYTLEAVNFSRFSLHAIHDGVLGRGVQQDIGFEDEY